MEKLLFHVCCAPCASYPSLEILRPRYDLAWYFYNPNLVPLEEYGKRLVAVQLVAGKYDIPLFIEPYSHDVWRGLVRGREKDPERGKRCLICYKDRLFKTAVFAKEQGFSRFSTSLLVSPYKDTDAIRTLGLEAEKTLGISFLAEDFQADNGYRKSQEFAKDLGLYRQKFCGCEFSRPDNLIS